ncbi:hypothetical protein O2W15_09735 [Modestobacter sp. VKM Ac-2979]|uniref:hypothetical protein n=1 Tax=unclassified Modestobacter TaxID=2643866 RepID=UPI0022AB5E9C|nr:MULTISPECIES: hypothetical protein [unclassified Modestobacter]MCZ2811717.1 hypothetical protein [Modestobacter sp. VKM Ac-2979]MCZ2843440.1 hypothetical protein [Modestobacter sp. VKM Ac-2980]
MTTEASTSNRMSQGQLEATLWRAANPLRGLVDPGVKRAVRRQVDGWWLERDNRVVGTDPWSFGEVADVDVSGVVRLRLWPQPGRTGDGSFCGWVDRRNP